MDTQNHRLFFDKRWNTLEMTRTTVFLLLLAFVAEGSFLPIRCIAMKEKYILSSLGPVTIGIHIQTQTSLYEARHFDGSCGRDINTSFIKIGSGIQELMRGRGGGTA
jgi:hypothetical protein